MSGKICGPAVPVKASTPNHTPAAKPEPKMCVEPPKQCIDRPIADSESQKQAQTAVGREPSNSAPTEKERTTQPKGTVRAGELARDGQSAIERGPDGHALATAVAANSTAGSLDKSFQNSAYKHARTVAAEHSRTAGQLRVMKRKLTGLENGVKNGAGAKAQKQLKAARTEYNAAKQAWTANKPLAREANKFLQSNPQLKDGGKVTKATKGADRFYKALKASKNGQRVLKGLKVISNPRLSKGLAILSGGLDAVSAYNNSSNRTTEGKIVNGGLAGLGNIAVTANPVGAVGALVLPEGYRPSDITRGGSGALSAMYEGLRTGDTRAAEDFQQRSENGEFGAVIQTASESGAYWAKNGVGKTFRDFGREVKGLFSSLW